MQGTRKAKNNESDTDKPKRKWVWCEICKGQGSVDYKTFHAGDIIYKLMQCICENYSGIPCLPVYDRAKDYRRTELGI